MRITIDEYPVVVHVRSLGKMTPHVRTKLWTALKAVDVDLIRYIKATMPVDTGRARASWGQWAPSDLVKPTPAAGPGDAIHQENERELEVTQGSNVPYIGALNAGHSKQAPAGFLDVGAEIARKQMTNLADRIVREERP